MANGYFAAHSSTGNVEASVPSYVTTTPNSSMLTACWIAKLSSNGSFPRASLANAVLGFVASCYTLTIRALKLDQLGAVRKLSYNDAGTNTEPYCPSTEALIGVPTKAFVEFSEVTLLTLSRCNSISEEHILNTFEEIVPTRLSMAIDKDQQLKNAYGYMYVAVGKLTLCNALQPANALLPIVLTLLAAIIARQRHVSNALECIVPALFTSTKDSDLQSENARLPTVDALLNIAPVIFL
jgi:hypothetical protein